MKVKLVDSTFYPFGGRSLSLGGDNSGMHPESFRWDGSDGPAPLKVFTDIRLKEAAKDTSGRKVALLLEPPAVSTMAYDTVVASDFFAVLTYDSELLKRGNPFAFYPFGGSWIRKVGWHVAPKKHLVSMIVGHKRSAKGHELRHEIAERLGGADLWGEPYTDYIDSKVVMLKPYMYSIVVENDKRDFWFTEKLIDCFALGTIPIYWGCPSIDLFFNPEGVLSFDTLDELRAILSKIGANDYNARFSAMIENKALARNYFCAEDWIYKNYPALFRDLGL